MEKKEAGEAKTKKKLMKYIPRASSALSFQNLHFSPGRDAKNRPHAAAQNRGFSGPLTSLVPLQVRGNNNAKAKNREAINGGYGFDSEVDEPRSPKVSCIGQIKQRKKLHQLNRSNKADEVKRSEPKRVDKGSKRNQNQSFANIFRRKQSPSTAGITAVKVVAPPPSLSQMKMFSSGRDAFVDFDWAKQDRECYSDNEERRRDWDEEEEGGGGGDVTIPYSAPMMIGGGEYYGGDNVIVLEPRKEICLWKKRNMAAPKPLKLNTFR